MKSRKKKACKGRGKKAKKIPLSGKAQRDFKDKGCSVLLSHT
jgi:hypothetical protein